MDYAFPVRRKKNKDFTGAEHSFHNKTFFLVFYSKTPSHISNKRHSAY